MVHTPLAGKTTSTEVVFEKAKVFGKSKEIGIFCFYTGGVF